MNADAVTTSFAAHPRYGTRPNVEPLMLAVEDLAQHGILARGVLLEHPMSASSSALGGAGLPSPG